MVNKSLLLKESVMIVIILIIRQHKLGAINKILCIYNNVNGVRSLLEHTVLFSLFNIEGSSILSNSVFSIISIKVIATFYTRHFNL